MHRFGGFLLGLEVSLKGRLTLGMSVVVAGDFNAKARSWGTGVDDPRGVTLEVFVASLGLWQENIRSVPTFSVGDRTSVVNVTLARRPKGSSINGWGVRDDVWSNSDHSYVELELSPATH